MIFIVFIAAVSRDFLVAVAFPKGWFVANLFFSLNFRVRSTFPNFALNHIRFLDNFRRILIVRLLDTGSGFHISKIDFKFRMACCHLFLLSDYAVIEFGQVR